MKGKTPSITSSAEVISGNDDLLLEILILLPAKSLIRFKSVSKRWRYLISDASFRQLHTRRHRRPQTSFLLSVGPSEFYHFNPASKNLTPFHFNFDHLIIRQSCKGLLLIQCGDKYNDYYVYNPTTGESRNLLVPDYKISGIFLVFDPSRSPHYKVFCLWFATSSLVYDSETHTWNRDEVVNSIHPPLRRLVYSDNYIYSLSHEGILAYFNIEKFIFRMPYFEDIDTERPLNVLCIMESFGHVYCIARDTATNNVGVDEMTAQNGELLFKHLFNFDITPWCPVSTPWQIIFLGIIRGEMEVDSLVFHIPGRIMAYRFYERRFEELLDCSTQEFYEDGSLQFTYDYSFQFVESLAPV